MQFDLFHSIGRIDSISPVPSDRKVFESFLRQCTAAESMDLNTVWVAESHFSSETQKRNPSPVIPNYQGEVGLNTDSCQLAHIVFNSTKKIGFGTAIHNIVGGNGGPIASADRVRALSFLNDLSKSPRKLNIGFAAGRFPYINRPFGILPRNTTEEILWPIYQRLIFIEATEIFLRLLRGETLSSMSTKNWLIDSSFFKSQDDFQAISKKLNALGLDESQFNYRKRWQFDDLTLVPKIDLNSRDYQNLTFTIGSHDPLARDHALNICDLDIFNLSFTPPDQIEKIHEEMSLHYLSKNKLWSRNKLPRTVLTFIDRSGQRARDRASACFDTYIEAMRGTVALPSKEHLMARALIGDPLQIIEQLNHSPDHGFNRDDRLMLWFEFNQVNCEDIIDQMALFADKVMPFVS